jgi:hypothetical protein
MYEETEEEPLPVNELLLPLATRTVRTSTGLANPIRTKYTADIDQDAFDRKTQFLSHNYIGEVPIMNNAWADNISKADELQGKVVQPLSTLPDPKPLKSDASTVGDGGGKQTSSSGRDGRDDPKDEFPQAKNSRSDDDIKSVDGKSENRSYK